ncbi:MAG TPA: hypothetical protein VGQ80_06525, partial [Acidimicrobiia bacterium]|nr:hypothetical protein [Acidimicrobiia bacterium]
AVLGQEAESGFRGGPWGLSDSGELSGLFDDAGFTDVRLVRRTLPVVFDGGPAQIVATLQAAAVGPQVAALDDRGRADLLAAAEEALAPLLDDVGGVRSEAASHIVVATR